jgi:hypothetical protein
VKIWIKNRAENSALRKRQIFKLCKVQANCRRKEQGEVCCEVSQLNTLHPRQIGPCSENNDWEENESCQESYPASWCISLDRFLDRHEVSITQSLSTAIRIRSNFPMEPWKLYHGKGLSESVQLSHEMTSEFLQPSRSKRNYVSILLGIELLRGSFWRLNVWWSSFHFV